MRNERIEKRKNTRPATEQPFEILISSTGWKILGGAVLALVAAAVIVNLPDIKRYIKISTM